MVANMMQNIYGEMTFVCLSYWMAQGYTDTGHKLQSSVLPAVHASDMTAALYQFIDF